MKLHVAALVGLNIFILAVLALDIIVVKPVFAQVDDTSNELATEVITPVELTDATTSESDAIGDQPALSEPTQETYSASEETAPPSSSITHPDDLTEVYIVGTK